MPDSPARLAPTTRRAHTVTAARHQLEELITRGDILRNGRLPAERSLAAELQVSRGTLRHALQEIAAKGMIRSAPQSGWLLTAAPLGEPPQSLISFTTMARRQGIEPSTTVIKHLVRPASYDEAQQLWLSPLSPVLELERLRELAGTPVCLDHSVVALAHAPGLERIDLTNRSLYEELEQLGARPTRSDFAVEAGLAGERTATLLRVAPEDPILIGVETSMDKIGRRLLIGRARYRWQAYRFHATLTRR